MNFKKVIASFVFILCLAISSEVNASSAFSDVEDNKYFSEAVTELHRLGYISGYADGKFKPYAFMTRAEVAQLVSKFSGRHYNFMNLYETYERIGFLDLVQEQYGNRFSDVKKQNWFFTSVLSLSEDGIIKGYPSGQFKPNTYVTRADFALILAGAFELTAQVEESNFKDISNHYAKDAIKQLEKLRLVNGRELNSFEPNESITRAEVATIIFRLNQVLHFKEVVEPVNFKQDSLAIEEMAYGNLKKESYYLVEGEDMESFLSVMPVYKHVSYKYNETKNYLAYFDSGCMSHTPINHAFINDEGTVTFNVVPDRFIALQQQGEVSVCPDMNIGLIVLVEISNSQEVKNIRFTNYPFGISESTLIPVINFK